MKNNTFEFHHPYKNWQSRFSSNIWETEFNAKATKKEEEE